MSNDRIRTVERLLEESSRALARAAGADLSAVVAAADAMSAAFERGGKVLLFGNGGSAADAQHLAAELVVRFVGERRALAAIALTTDPSVLTAAANDLGYERVFARQIEALGAPGDVAIGISTSGASASVAVALDEASRQGLRTIALTGNDGGSVGAKAEIHVNVPESSTARVQEVHGALIHALCVLIEQRIGQTGAPPTP